MDAAHAAEIFPHMRILLGTVIGLGIARLLLTVAGFIQHPRQKKASLLHLLWVGSVLLEMVLFWWWEFSLFRFGNWNFGIAVFLLSFAILLFMLSALLSPDNLDDYSGYEEFFIDRRGWFFGTFAVIAVFDVIDTLLKGAERVQAMGGDAYFLNPIVGITVCFIGWRVSSRRVQLAIVIVHIIYQISVAARFFTAQ